MALVKCTHLLEKHRRFGQCSDKFQTKNSIHLRFDSVPTPRPIPIGTGGGLVGWRRDVKLLKFRLSAETLTKTCDQKSSNTPHSNTGYQKTQTHCQTVRTLTVSAPPLHSPAAVATPPAASRAPLGEKISRPLDTLNPNHMHVKAPDKISESRTAVA